jgi:hypothetical protein
MSQPTVKWGQAQRYFLRHHYTIKSSGGDKFIIAPKDGNHDRSRQSIRVGHTSCSHSGSPILPVYLSKFKNVFGVTIDDILKD